MSAAKWESCFLMHGLEIDKSHLWDVSATQATVEQMEEVASSQRRVPK